MNVEDLAQLKVAWTPPPGLFESSPLGKLAVQLGLSTPEEVASHSLSDPEGFWAAAAEDVGLQWMEPYQQVLDLSDGPEHPHFFKGGKLNWADYSVDRWVRQGRGDAQAIWWEGDDGSRADYTYAELKRSVDALAGGLMDLGVAKGDVVALLLPMIPEAMISMMAAVKIGAIVAPMFSGYGPEPIRYRLKDSRAKVIVTCDGFFRRGRIVPLKALLDDATEGLESLEHVVVVRRSGVETAMQPGHDEYWDETLHRGTPVVQAPAFDVETPCILIYSSGSTGRPKGCVHTHAGLPFKFAQESRHGFGLGPGSRILWLTDMGWVMGSYLTTAAFTNGATAVVFEGVPDFPEPDRLWDVADRSRTEVLGIAPTVVRALMAHGKSWPDRHPMADLRAIGTTGEPWNLEPWWWCFRHVGKERAPIVNISGGTECGASIVVASLYRPVKPTSFSGHQLGMDADVVDDQGHSVRGQVGELVVRQPWPGMTKSLWEGDERYLDAYWSRFPGCWVQGDLAYVDPDGFWYLLGRSDDTIMLAGKRVGPAEIESILVGDPDVVESAAIGVPDEVKGEALVCFVVLRPGADREGCEERLGRLITDNEGKVAKAKAIHVVQALPKTRNGKVMRRIAKAAYLEERLGDVTALDNPEVLPFYKGLA